MDFISKTKLLAMSKRGLGIIGLVLLIIFSTISECDFFIIDPGIYHYKWVWLVNSLLVLWLSLSVGYKIILIFNLELEKINLSLMGWFAHIVFAVYFALNLVTTITEVPMKMAWYYTLVLTISIIGSIVIDAFTPFTDIDENVQSVKKVVNFFIPKFCRRRGVL